MPYFSANWYNPDEYKDIRNLVDFFTTKELQYWKMSAHNELNATGERVYVLAEPGSQYVVYAANGGAFSFEVPTGPYNIWRYYPAIGKEEKLPKM